MRFSDGATIAALQNAPQDGLAPRSLVWITGRHRVTGALESFGWWNEPLPVTMDVVSGQTGEIANRLYEGDGGLMRVGAITLSANIRIRTVDVTLNKNNERVKLAIRGFNPKGALIEIHRVPLSMASRLPVAPPRCRFIGYVDNTPFTKPAAGGESTLILKCVSTTAELTKTNPAKRSDETQRLRLVGAVADRHLQYVDKCHMWDIPWGEP